MSFSEETQLSFKNCTQSYNCTGYDRRFWFKNLNDKWKRMYPPFYSISPLDLYTPVDDNIETIDTNSLSVVEEYPHPIKLRVVQVLLLFEGVHGKSPSSSWTFLWPFFSISTTHIYNSFFVDLFIPLETLGLKERRIFLSPSTLYFHFLCPEFRSFKPCLGSI